VVDCGEFRLDLIMEFVAALAEMRTDGGRIAAHLAAMRGVHRVQSHSHGGFASMSRSGIPAEHPVLDVESEG